MQIWKDRVLSVYKNMTSNEGALFVYAFAYSIIISIAPFLVIIVLGTSLVDTNDIISFVTNYIPQELIVPFVEYLRGTDVTHWGFISTLFIASIWLSSKSVYSFLIVSTAHDEVDISHFILRLLSFVYFIVLILEIVAITLLINNLPVLRKTTSFFAIFTFFVLFYRMIAFKHTEIKNFIWGSLMSTVLILLLGRLFFVYVNKFTNYQTIYGPLASLMILFLSGFAISWIAYFGYCINFAFRDPDKDNSQKSYILNRFGRTGQIKGIKDDTKEINT